MSAAETLTCTLDPARAAALHAALDRPGDPPRPGDPLPAFWHQAYFWDPRRPAALGRDGHPRVGGGIIPDLGLPQRMWAGGHLTFHAKLRIGTPATRRTTLEDVTEKAGHSGRLGFVALRHDISQDGTLCVTERQDLVYRDPPGTRRRASPPPAPTAPHRTLDVAFDSTLLFRYSALTFNGHRIHYDADYARDVEGYPGLVVHGPLLAQLLIHLAEDTRGPLAAFAFRGTSPLTAEELATLCLAENGAMWVRAGDGRMCMDAAATFSSV